MTHVVKKWILINDVKNVCKSCTVVNGYDLQAPYSNYNEFMYKIRKKGVYIRRYHILNIIT